MTQANRVGTGADAGEQQLKGHIPGWVRPERRVTQAVDPSAPVHLSIILSRDPAVQAAFAQFLDDQQNPKSPYYHQWLKPDQIGELFGPTQSDLDAVTGWLAEQGLKVESIAPSHIIVEASGSTATVGRAFRTSFGYFTLNQKPVLSAVSDPFVPGALVPVIKSIHGLTQTELEAHPVPEKPAAPGLTIPDNDQPNNANHFLAPGDFDTIYDLAGIKAAGNIGASIGSTPQRIAVIGRSRVYSSDVSIFESTFLLPNVSVVPVIPPAGADPGYANGDPDLTEATLDVERIMGTAPGAIIDLVVSATTNGEDGNEIAASYAINNVVDPIVSISFARCEQAGGSSESGFWDSLFSSAAAEGTSVFVAAGDSGAAGCDIPFTAPPSSQALNPNVICASSYATCVGGTEFNDSANPSAYWSGKDAQNQQSALGYIPEGAWNESTSTSASGGGGGVSAYITKPPWQTGTNVPNDGFRDTPDIAFASAAHTPYLICITAQSSANCLLSTGVAGTSAATPGMAGIAALLNTAAGSRQGNMNPLIYRLAATTPTAFHDVTVNSSGVADCTAQVVSICNNSDSSPSGALGLAGYIVGPGYDQATGWGSLDAGVFISVATAPPAATTLALASSQAIVGGVQPITFTATISSPDTISYPSGTIQFYANGTALDPPIPVGTNANYALAYNISGSNPYGTPITSSAANGTAILTTTLALANTYTITAVYSGDPSFLGSTSSAVSVTVPDANYVLYSQVLGQSTETGVSLYTVTAQNPTTEALITGAYFTGPGARFFAVDPSSTYNAAVSPVIGVYFNPTYVPVGSQFDATLVVQSVQCPIPGNAMPISNPNLIGDCATNAPSTVPLIGVVTGSLPSVPAQIQFTPTKPVVLFAAPGARSAVTDQNGNIYVSYGSTVQEYEGSNWTATPVAGSGVTGYGGDGGKAVSAQLNSVDGMLSVPPRLYLADSPNNLVQVVSGGFIQPFAGLYYPPSDLQSADGQGSGTCGTTTSNYVFYTSGCYTGYPMGSAGYLVNSIEVYGNSFAPFSGPVSNYLNYPTSLASDGQNLYIADTDNSLLRQVTPQGLIYDLAGVGSCPTYQVLSPTSVNAFCNIYPGDTGDGGLAWNADIETPTSVAVDPHANIFVASSVSPVLYGNSYISSFLVNSNVPLSNSIRRIGTDNTISTPMFNGSPLTGTGLAFDNLGNLYIAGNDTTPYVPSNNPIQKVTFDSNGNPSGVTNWAPYGGVSPSFDNTGEMIVTDGANVNQVGGSGSLSFPAQNFATTSGALSETITNPGGAALVITSADGITGPNASAFSVTSDGCSGKSIQSGATCTIQVAFTPNTLSASSATISVLTNVSGGSTQFIYLSGTTVSPITLTAPSPNAGNYTFGGSIGSLITTASHGTPPYTFSINFPAGSGQWSISGNGASATVSGTPFEIAAIPFTVTATDSLGQSGSVNATLNVTRKDEALLMINATQTPIPTGTSVAYSATVSPLSATYSGMPLPTGSVQFKLDSLSEPAGVLSNEATPTATLSTDILYHTLTANYSSDANYDNEFASAVYYINGNRPQTISFPGGLKVPVGSKIALTAIANSGLPVTYAVVAGNATIDASGTNLIVGNSPGLIQVQASQAGNQSFASASPVIANFNAF